MATWLFILNYEHNKLTYTKPKYWSIWFNRVHSDMQHLFEFSDWAFSQPNLERPETKFRALARKGEALTLSCNLFLHLGNVSEHCVESCKGICR